MEPMETRILHIWNTAGCASIVAKFLDRHYPTKSWVITRSVKDKFGFTVYGETLDIGPLHFGIETLRQVRKYDLIHVHALDKIVPWIKRFYPKKPVLLHYEGSNVRGQWSKRRKYWQVADKITVSTSDLLEGAPEGVTWQPNPVDTDLFYASAKGRKKGHAFHIAHDADDLARKYSENRKLELTIHDRSSEPISYTEMGDVLSSYEYYIDVKRSYSQGARGKLIQVLSKTGLEALACECKVINWNDEVLTGLPDEHRPENVVAEIWKKYQDLLEGA